MELNRNFWRNGGFKPKKPSVEEVQRTTQQDVTFLGKLTNIGIYQKLSVHSVHDMYAHLPVPPLTTAEQL